MGIADKFDIGPDRVPPLKLGVHVGQIVLAFIIFVLEIVLFRTDDAKIESRNGWVLGLVCRHRLRGHLGTMLSVIIPVILY